MFKPGVSGNPNGRPRSGTSLAELLRLKDGPKAIKIIAKLCKHKDPSVSLKAAQYLADRAYGKAPQALAGESGQGPVELVIKWAGEHEPTAPILASNQPTEPAAPVHVAWATEQPKQE